jgi:hypothetical protein
MLAITLLPILLVNGHGHERFGLTLGHKRL